MSTAEILGLAIVGVGVAVVLGVLFFHFVTALWRVHFDRAIAPGLFWAALGEAWAFMRIVLWNITGRSRLQPEDVAEDADVVVVLVHGACADGTCTTGWRRALIAAGVNAPILAPDHGLVVRSLSVHVARTAAFIDRVRRRSPGARLVFVGHSMGGLVIRQLLADDDVLRAATLGVITVASPHCGTASLRWVPFDAVSTLGHLQVGHAGLAGLPALEKLVARSAFIASAVDVIVYPKTTSLPEGATVFSFDDVGHAALLVDAAVATQVAALVVNMIEDAPPVVD
ncbi:MAG: hypothetical protein Q8O67_26705 [Deltaproteobacteria bacterium]|nr:hypothetical protein [Deltaproteobacteria bacterium]